MNVRKQGRRSAQTAESTKYQILTVAAEMFCTLGYERVSLRNISDSAGVSHSLIRHHFGSKEQIWYAISDKLHEYMEGYLFALLEDIDQNLPVNQRLYQFCIRMNAHMLLVPKPLQFTADVVRQEGEFFDYMVDKHGKIEHVFDILVEEFNSKHPKNRVNMWEQKWLLISSAHAAISLKPFLKAVWPDSKDDESRLLVNHWELYNSQVAKNFLIEEDQMLHSDDLSTFLLPMAECWNRSSCCLDEEEA
ncbi:TetR/AcrR family transcriptional regulator [Vibrio hannami]|uniref:TetR/AcrR family transcriptional regulator n=1 Tax=Vibrio hannami TaxID=2717094 RepID=UPI00240FF256|nr:TetR/AcrR family transcriptional regulator [Vibrio hannami]MDG3085592.1 TetR/AcrR family transcriptional regulator [Vibrio hannami]